MLEEVKRLKDLEAKFLNSSNEEVRDLYSFILFKISGTESVHFQRKKDQYFNDFIQFNEHSLAELLKSHLRKRDRINCFNELLELHKKVDGKLSEKNKTDIVEDRIKLAQEEQSEIENDLSGAIFFEAENLGLKIEIKKDRLNIENYLNIIFVQKMAKSLD